MKVKKTWFRENRLFHKLPSQVDRAQENRIRLLRGEILDLLTRDRFVSFTKLPKLQFDNKLNCLWLLHGFQTGTEDMFQQLTRLKIHHFSNWELPTLEEVRSIAREKPFARHEKFRNAVILSRTPGPKGEGYQTVTFGSSKVGIADGVHTIIPLHRVGQHNILSFIIAHSLPPAGVPEATARLNQLYALTMEMARKQTEQPPPTMEDLQKYYLEGDHVRARLPKLDVDDLYDMSKGVWELYQPNKPVGRGWVEMELDPPWEARNPEQDLRDGAVSIDFGTSSTVVACREHGQVVLLRVGVTDFARKPTPEDYENPAILEFVNLPNLLAAWKYEAFRPLTRWDDFHFSHEALSNLRKNEADQRIVASMLTTIKQWPLGARAGRSIRIADQATGSELEIHHSQSPMPVPGQRLTVSRNDPFDPIELYAYYLGLFINNRSNGLFLNYYMTFPVTYPKAVKKRILTSFARGLMRSLPPSLIDSPRMRDFRVQEEASEPAAYAACALEELDIEATEGGTPFAVFDFGGGSTDFDFGLYRLPTPEEKEQGYERVINHFGASGDMFLGGENLVANLAYLVFCQNLEVCREKKIPFSRPPEGERFPGHEFFLDQSHVAQTNSAQLMAKVRHYWEAFCWDLPESEGRRRDRSGEGATGRRVSDRIGDILSQAILDMEFNLDPETASCEETRREETLEMELLNRNREKTSVTFVVDRNKLNHYLVARVGKGIHRFFIAMRQAFDGRDLDLEEVRVLQAGNASRALLVQALFAGLAQDRMFKWKPPHKDFKKNPVLERFQESIVFKRLIIHRPPRGDPDDLYKPTAKTGVAIGLLKLIPGEPLLAIDFSTEDGSGEAPFLLFVGKLKKGVFQPVLMQNGPYKVWEKLGTPTRGSFVLIYATSPQAGLGELRRGSRELQERSIVFGPGSRGKKLFIRAVGPSEVELCLCNSLEQMEKQPEKIVYQEVVSLM